MITSEKQAKDLDRLLEDYAGAAWQEMQAIVYNPATLRKLLREAWDAGWDQGFAEGDDPNAR